MICSAFIKTAAYNGNVLLAQELHRNKMPVAVRLVEFAVALMLFLLVIGGGFLLYCAQHIIVAFMAVSQPLIMLIVLTLYGLQNCFIWFAEIMLAIVIYLSGYGMEKREVVY